MPRIECPQCQTVRVIMEGKVKRCQKCDTKLTTLPVVAKQPAPDGDGQVAEIQAQLDAALDHILNLQDMQTKSLDELTAEQLCETIQILADALVQRPEQLTAKGQKWAPKVAKFVRVDRWDMVLPPVEDEPPEPGDPDANKEETPAQPE
jgi:hypothetical protein